jgi:50S ribosomal subunit-associated GTPase HflX
MYEISAVTGEGIEELKYAMAKEVNALREQALKQVEAAEGQIG